MIVAGLLEVSSGGINIGGAATAANFKMTGGGVFGPGNLTITGASTWSRGQVGGSSVGGSVRFDGPLTLTVGPGDFRFPSHRVFFGSVTFAGITTLTNAVDNRDATFLLDDGSLRNAGTLLDQTALNPGFAMAFTGRGSCRHRCSTTTVVSDRALRSAR